MQGRLFAVESTATQMFTAQDIRALYDEALAAGIDPLDHPVIKALDSNTLDTIIGEER